MAVFYVKNTKIIQNNRGVGVLEQWGIRWRLVSSCTVQRAVKYRYGPEYEQTEAEGCLIGIKSDMLIRMVTLTNVDTRAGPG